MMIWNGLLIDYEVEPGLLGDIALLHDAVTDFTIEGVFDADEFASFLEEHDRSEVEMRAARRMHVSSRSATWIHRTWDYEVLEAAEMDLENKIAYARDEQAGV